MQEGGEVLTFGIIQEARRMLWASCLQYDKPLLIRKLFLVNKFGSHSHRSGTIGPHKKPLSKVQTKRT